MICTKRYMLDTNVFGHLVEGKVWLADLPLDGSYWATSIQWQEFQMAPLDVRKKFKELTPAERQVAPAFAWGVPGAGWGEGEMRNEDILWNSLRDSLDSALENELRNQPPKKEKRTRKLRNNIVDAAIAEAAAFNGMTVIAADGALADVLRSLDIDVLYLKPRTF